jgi:hypothetical protein
MGTLIAANARITIEDENGVASDYWINIPAGSIEPTDNSLVLLVAHYGILRAIILGALKRSTITIPYAITSGDEIPVSNGRLIAHSVKFKLLPGSKNNPATASIPAYKWGLLDDPYRGKTRFKRTRASQSESDTAELTAAWSSGLGGVKPVNVRGGYFDQISDGLLVSKR